jgi:hypothetical protein
MKLNPRNPYRHSPRHRARQAFLAEVDLAADQHRAEIVDAVAQANIRAVKAVLDGLTVIEGIGDSPLKKKVAEAFGLDLVEFAQLMAEPVPKSEDEPHPFGLDIVSDEPNRPLPSMATTSPTAEQKHLAAPSPDTTPTALGPPKRKAGRPKGSKNRPKLPSNAKPSEEPRDAENSLTLEP